jgi:two-component system, OmpR family, sensor histidine kinase VicK
MDSDAKPHEAEQEIWILNGSENILNFYITRANLIKKDVACCYDYAGPIRIKLTVPIWRTNLEVDKKGIKVRFLTDIRNENLEYCKKILEEIKHIEMRHVDDVRGNFTIHDDREFFLPMFVNKLEEPVKDALFCTQKEMVEAHLFIFENLWKKGLPAEERIKQIEEGYQPTFTETVRDPFEIDRIGYDLIKSANKEIQLMMSSTVSTFSNQEVDAYKPSILKLLLEKVSNEEIKVRILLPPGDNKNYPALIPRKGLGERDDRLAVQYLDPDLQATFSTLIVDRKYLLAVEYKDGTKNETCKSIGMATYSNSEATIMSYISIFDTMWIRTELLQKGREGYVVG